MSEKYVVALLLFGLVFGQVWARPSNVFVGNQQMQLDAETAAVSVIHFIRLVESDRRDMVKLEGRTLVVIDEQGESHQLPLNQSRRLVEWSQALTLLGYIRKENLDTGVVDYRLVEDSKEPELVESDEVKQERSMRRPAYRKAQENFQKVLLQIGRSEDDETRTRIQRIGQRIVKECPLSGLLWKFELLETPTPNALCTGEGHVIVTTGLMDLNLTDDELAGVLGHEVAHGVRRHAQIYEERFNEYVRLRNKVQQLSYQYQQATDGGTPYEIQRLKSQVGELEKRYEFVVDYLKKKQDYDQDEEEESDVLGMQYAAAAGFDPMGEGRALVKLRKRSVQLFGQAYNQGSRTHPPLERRLKIQETVRRRWQEERYRR
jgi:hypothetical protein